jgi:hypothetical protein
MKTADHTRVHVPSKRNKIRREDDGNQRSGEVREKHHNRAKLYFWNNTFKSSPINPKPRPNYSRT